MSTVRRVSIALPALACAAAIAASAAAPSLGAAATSCGKVSGVALSAHGVTCATARTVYRDNLRGRSPKGWVCSSALHKCGKGRLSSSKWIAWGYAQGQQQSPRRPPLATTAAA